MRATKRSYEMMSKVTLESEDSSVAASPHIHLKLTGLGKKFPTPENFKCALTQGNENSGGDALQGKHPYTSRTRRLSLKRPMILYWRRYGKAGGCQITKRGYSSAG